MDVHMSYSDYKQMYEDAFPVYALILGIGLAAVAYEKIDDYLWRRKHKKEIEEADKKRLETFAKELD